MDYSLFGCHELRLFSLFTRQPLDSPYTLECYLSIYFYFLSQTTRSSYILSNSVRYCDLESAMNWTGGRLQRHSKDPSALQKQRFAKPRPRRADDAQIPEVFQNLSQFHVPNSQQRTLSGSYERRDQVSCWGEKEQCFWICVYADISTVHQKLTREI